MKNKWVILLIVVLLVVIGGLYYVKVQKDSDKALIQKANESANVVKANVEDEGLKTEALNNINKEEYVQKNGEDVSFSKKPESGNDGESTETTISQNDAEKLLEEKYGKKDEMTGNTMSYSFLATVKDNKENKYYAFREAWLVDNSHMSFLQNVFVSYDGKTIKTVSKPEGYEENQVVTFDED